jgi:hypothetical protein
MPEKSKDQWDAASPVPQDQDDELEMADDKEDLDDEDFDEENETDKEEGVEEP